MRRTAWVVLGLALASTGCLAVSATDNSKGWRSSKEVVAVGDQVYIVDTRTGQVNRVDLEKAQPMEAVPNPDYQATEID